MKNISSLDKISFLNENEQIEIINLFITSSKAFFCQFKESYKRENILELKKICHNYGSSLIVFNLEDCLKILKKILIKLNEKNFEEAFSLMLILENKVNSFISKDLEIKK